ncbi:MAG: hypothetical protein H6831_00120 [Planctomycetes bacterium]|nr:hypothetical protein [Planctomycetota bacterium]MCB9902790.1 hypothetical protein [Planctomycetota bacterium]
MERERAWACVHAALDERRDPLDDALLQEWFAAHPEALEEYARFERRLELFETTELAAATERAAPQPRRRLLELAATLAAALVAALAAPRGTPEHEAHPRSANAPSPRVVDYRLTATRVDAQRSFTASRSSDGPLRITNTSNALPTNGTLARPHTDTFDPETNR